MAEYKGKCFYGTVKVGERGQIVIPKKTRDEYDIKPGDSLVVFGDNNKLFKIMKADLMRDFALKVLEDLDDND
jgi:AbrB family looped-hinge helix DNA binding protein